MEGGGAARASGIIARRKVGGGRGAKPSPFIRFGTLTSASDKSVTYRRQRVARAGAPHRDIILRFS